jgi:hypothetical protein
MKFTQGLVHGLWLCNLTITLWQLWPQTRNKFRYGKSPKASSDGNSAYNHFIVSYSVCCRSHPVTQARLCLCNTLSALVVWPSRLRYHQTTTWTEWTWKQSTSICKLAYQAVSTADRACLTIVLLDCDSNNEQRKQNHTCTQTSMRLLRLTRLL